MATNLPNPAGGSIRPNSPRALVCALLGTCLLLAGASAHAVDWLAPLKLFGGDDDEQIIFQGPGQYVKIVDQDRLEKYGRAPKNDHPANISAKDFAAVLATLQVRKEEGSAPIFTPAEIAVIAPKLSDALSKTKPTQDVIFAASDAQGKSGFATTAGRVFVESGALNIILGDTLQSGGSGAGQVIDHKDAPFRPGRRREAMDTAHGMAGGPGIGFLPGYRSPRYDWAIIDVPTTVAAYRGPQVPLVTAPEAAAATPGAVPDDTAKLLQERQQMREEMARMKKQLDDKDAAAAPAVSPVPQGSATSAPAASAIPEGTRAPAAPAAEARPAAGSTAPATASKGGAESVEQRLSILQSLHAKKLITDDEYAAKRKAILEEL